MDLSSISPEVVSAQQVAMAGSAFGIQVMRKTLDMAATEGADLVKLMQSAGGIGQNINTTA